MPTAAQATTAVPTSSAPSTRVLLVALLGNHLQGRDPSPDATRDVAVPTRTFLAALEPCGAGAAAVRAALARAGERGLLAREQHGREVHHRATAAMRRLLADGARRLHHTPAVRTAWDGTWTLLAFSLPEERRGDRNRLRQRLSWAGFGPARNGLWIAPGRVTVDLGDDLTDHVHAFAGEAISPTDVDGLVSDTWDLDGLAAAYQRFVARWDRDEPPVPSGPLARSIHLVTEWRALVRDDPHLPAELLPDDWPAGRAREVFDRWFEHDRSAADATFDQLLSTP